MYLANLFRIINIHTVMHAITRYGINYNAYYLKNEKHSSANPLVQSSVDYIFRECSNKMNV